MAKLTNGLSETWEGDANTFASISVKPVLRQVAEAVDQCELLDECIGLNATADIPRGTDHLVRAEFAVLILAASGTAVLRSQIRARPNAEPFMTAEITMEPVEGGTRYRALVRHKSPEDRAKHEAMGFHQGWGTCLTQLEGLAVTL